MEETEGTSEIGIYGFVQDIQRLAAIFFAENELMASTQLTRLHWELDVLTELFDRSCMCTNTGKKVSMACQNCCAIGATIWWNTASG